MTPIAIVLAAGSGRRLRPLTNDSPKCLLDIAGKPLLGRLLDSFGAAGVRRAVIVTGYLSHQVESYLGGGNWPLEIAIARNDAYATTNNAASLAVTRELIGSSDFLLCDGDVIFSESPIPALIASTDACVLAVDRDARLGSEDMKVQLASDGYVQRISKTLPPEDCAGESIGIQKIGGRAVPLLWDALDHLLPGRAADAYYEDAFQTLIDRGAPFGICPVVSDSWMEIDDLADLNAARLRFVAL